MIKFGELEHVLDNYCEVGMYNPKSGTDDEIVVVNLFFTEEDAARDLKIFLDYLPIDIVDVTVDSVLDDRFYKIFIELENNKDLFTSVGRILRDCSGLGNIEEWKVKVYRSEERTIKVKDLDKIFEKDGLSLDDIPEHEDTDDDKD